MSSFFDEASLVFIPSGYKTSKAYSIKPTDGSGDMTFSRSNDTATRVNSAGLIEKVRTNLVLQSEAFNTTWAVNGIVVTANTAANPLTGATNADTITADAANNFHLINQSITYAAGEATVSVYVKANGYTWFVIDPSITNAFGYYNITTGVVGTKGSACTTSITNVGGGWYRCSVTFTATAGAAVLNFSIRNADNGGSFLGDGVGGFFIYGAQAEMGVATDYIATTSAAVSVGPVANVPRLDYLNSSCPRLLLEPQRQNALLQSENLSSATWTKQGGSVTVNAVASPDGYTNADLFTEDTSTGDHRVYQNPISTSANQPVTFSVFAKYNGRQYIYIRTDDSANLKTAVFDIQNGTAGTVTSGATSKIENYGGGWYRCTITVAATANALTCEGLLGFLNGPSFSNALYTGNGTAGAYLWGFQAEANAAYATSYIPTLGAAVTRGADACSKTGISSLIGQTEGTIFAQWTSSNANTSGRIVAISNGGFANRIAVLDDASKIRVFISNASVVEIDETNLGNYTGSHKIAVAYANNNLAVYLDGTLVLSRSTLSVPACSALYVGTLEDGTSATPLNGGVAQTLLFKTRLTNAQLAELTTI